jgi:hypothetical protein
VLRHAVSADGRKWSVTPRPVLELSQEWEAEILVYPTVLKIDGVYLMWYGSYYSAVRRQTTAIGFAASLDGLVWHKHPQNPVLRPDPKRPWESHYVGSGCVLRLADGSFRYWYASRKEPPFVNLYFALNTARWFGPPALKQPQKLEAPPEHVQAYLRRCEQAKTDAIRDTEAQIKMLQNKHGPKSDHAVPLHVAEIQLRSLRDRPAPLLPLPLPPKKGDVGVVPGAEARGPLVDVLEVVDGANAIVRVWFRPTLPAIRPANPPSSISGFVASTRAPRWRAQRRAYRRCST